jgi:hypothetical protein
MSMTTHYTIVAEIDRQRREQIAASIAASRRHRPQGRRRWWERHFLHRPGTTVSPTAAAPSRIAAI